MWEDTAPFRCRVSGGWRPDALLVLTPLPLALAELERGDQAAPAPLSTVGGEGGWGGEDLPTPERQQSYGPMERLRATQAALSLSPDPFPNLWVMHSPERERGVCVGVAMHQFR